MSRIVLVVVLMMSLSVAGSAQFNLKIGYESAFIRSPLNKEIVSAFNLENQETLAQGQELSPLGFNNGLTLGLMYKWDDSRLSINWHSTSSRKKAFGETTDPVMSFEREVRYRMGGFGIQYEVEVKRLALGVGFGRDVLQMTSLIEGSSNDKTILNEPTYNFRFNLGFKIMNTERVCVVLEPYYTYFISEIDHFQEYRFFGVPTAGVNTEDRPHYFGVQLLFYNGKQN